MRNDHRILHVIIVTRNQNKKENDFHNQNFHNQIYDHYHSNSLMERINKKNNFQEIYRSKLNTDSLLQNSITISFQKSQLIAMVKLCPKLATEASRWPSSIEQGGKIITTFPFSFPSISHLPDLVARPMLRSLKRLTTQTELVDPIVRPTTNPNDPSMWHLDSWSRLYTGIAHLPDRVDRFAAYWSVREQRESVARRPGGGWYWDARCRKGWKTGRWRKRGGMDGEGRRRWTTHTSASNWLELFPWLISRTC